MQDVLGVAVWFAVIVALLPATQAQTGRVIWEARIAELKSRPPALVAVIVRCVSIATVVVANRTRSD